MDRTINRVYFRTAAQSGRLAKDGPTLIRERVNKMLPLCTITRNTKAERLGLGPCRVSSSYVPHNEEGRPKVSFSETQPDGTSRKPMVFLYHATWVNAFGYVEVMENGQAPSYSHRCHEKKCCEAKHGVWESGGDNARRNSCRAEGAGPCPHEPECLIGE